MSQHEINIEVTDPILGYIQKFHDLAMVSAHEADTYRRLGFAEEAKESASIAYVAAESAADMAKRRCDFEPTRGVLFLNAAWFAINCGLFTKAKELATEGLAGNPPEEFADKLREALAAAEKGADER